MKTVRKKAVVVGALGVIGRYIVERLLAEERLVRSSACRAAPADAGAALPPHQRRPARPAGHRAASSPGSTDATHIFYAAFQPSGRRRRGLCLEHRAQPRHAGQRRDGDRCGVARRCSRVVLVTGTKYYGSHLGPFKTPARESDPRHMPPNYYFDQIDWLTAFQRGKRWDWVELRPQTLCGFAPGTPMSLAAGHRGLRRDQQGARPAAALSRQARRLCVDLPGHRVLALRQCRAVGGDRAALRARSLQHHQRRLFPLVATCGRRSPRSSTCRPATPQTISLTEHMADKAPLWRAMTEKYGLKPFAFDQLVAWPFADYVFGCDWDVMSDVTKAAPLRFPRRGRQRGDVRAADAPCSAKRRSSPDHAARSRPLRPHAVEERRRRHRRHRLGRRRLALQPDTHHRGRAFSDYTGFDRLQVLVAAAAWCCRRPPARSTCASRSGRCASPAKRRSSAGWSPGRSRS